MITAIMIDAVITKHGSVRLFVGEGEGEVVSGRVEEKGKEDIWLGAGHCC